MRNARLYVWVVPWVRERRHDEVAIGRAGTRTESRDCVGHLRAICELWTL